MALYLEFRFRNEATESQMKGNRIEWSRMERNEIESKRLILNLIFNSSSFSFSFKTLFQRRWREQIRWLIPKYHSADDIIPLVPVARGMVPMVVFTWCFDFVNERTYSLGWVRDSILSASQRSEITNVRNNSIHSKWMAKFHAESLVEKSNAASS